MGSTLAELLIALVILGGIATFNIVKVMTGTYSARRAAVIKEAYSAISQITNTGRLERRLSNTTNFKSYIFENVNAIRLCNWNAATEGCWSHSVQGNPTWLSSNWGFVLANGATVTMNSWHSDSGLQSGEEMYVMLIDWNGPAPPNKYHTTDADNDQFEFWGCMGTRVCSTWMSPSLRPGRLGALSTASQQFLSSW